MRRSNCWWWAFRLWLRRRHKARRRYLVPRMSDWGPFPHLLYAEIRPSGRLRLVSYKPLDPKPHLIPPPWFEGHVVYGDPLP